MSISTILIFLSLLGVSAYYAGLKKSIALRKKSFTHSTPIYHGALLAISSSLMSVLFVILWVILEKNFFLELASYRNYLFTISIIIFLLTAVITFIKIRRDFKARDHLEKIIEYFLLCCSSIAILITIGIFLSVVFESNKFFESIKN